MRNAVSFTYALSATFREPCLFIPFSFGVAGYGLGCRSKRNSPKRAGIRLTFALTAAAHSVHHASRLDHVCDATRLPPPIPRQFPRGFRIDVDPDQPAPPVNWLDVRFRDISGQPVSVITGKVELGLAPDPANGIVVGTRPGKMAPHLYPSERMPIGGRERGSYDRTYTILPITDEMKWVRVKNNVLPEGESFVEGGEENGRVLYHARAWIDGTRVPGAVGGDLENAVFPWADCETHAEGDYDVLCWKRAGV